MNQKTTNLLIRTLSGIVYVALMVLSIYTIWIALPLCFFLVFVSLYEFADILEQSNQKFKGSLSFLFSAALCVLSLLTSMVYFQSYNVFILFSIALLALVIPELINKSETPMERIALSFFSQFWIVIPLGFLFILWIPMQPVQVLAYFIIIWASDTFAYVGGTLFGKHKLAEKISPGKTWEGFIISCILTVALAIALYHIPYFKDANMNLWKWIVFALTVEVFGLLGDLMESLFKRKAKVKDSGKIIPGHGGVLDRLDSILFSAIPVFLFCHSC